MIEPKMELMKLVSDFGHGWMKSKREYGREYRCLSIPRKKPLPREAEDDEAFMECVRAMREHCGELLVDAAATFYCYPAQRGREFWGGKEESQINSDICNLCVWILRNESNTFARHLLVKRLEGIVTRSLLPEATEVVARSFDIPVSLLASRRDRFEGDYFRPAVNDIGGLLKDVIDPEESKDDLDGLMSAKWNKPIYLDEYKEFRDSMDYFSYPLSHIVQSCAKNMMKKGNFDYFAFCKMADISTSLVDIGGIGLDEDGEPYKSSSKEDSVLADFAFRYAVNAYQKLPVNKNGGLNVDIDERELQPNKFLEIHHFPGAFWLIQTCQYIEKYNIKTSVIGDEDEIFGVILRKAAAVWSFIDGEDEEWLECQLSKFKASTLWGVLPFAGLGQKPILKALGAEYIAPLHEYVNFVVGARPYWPNPYVDELDNSDNENSGVLDLRRFDAVVSSVSRKTAQAYFKSLESSKLGYTRICYLCEAAMGLNTEKVEKSAGKLNQISLKALGLLPIENMDIAVARYIELRSAWKECKKYGAQRQANTRAAVAVGMKNLAQRSGYRDVSRMEWDLESEVSSQAESIFSLRKVGDWDVCVELQGIKTKLVVKKEGRFLKSVPVGLRKAGEYVFFREQMKTLDEQARRFRGSLEKMMCEGDRLDVGELKKIGKITAVRALLANIIGIDDAGHMGLIDASEASLAGIGNEKWKIKGKLRIAHIYDIFEAKVLSQWQRLLVERYVVQPFKQAFRELYILTPAEESSSPESNRYKGRSVNASVAYRLMQSRGWGMAEQYCDRIFNEKNIVAKWSFPEMRYYFAEEDTQLAGPLSFFQDGKAMPLNKVPEKIFSEVMRDADLVVSVGAVDDDGEYWSNELGAARISVVSEVARKLGFGNLSFEDRFVYIEGKRADYRVHMGSGNIHIMPGAYLCIVPDEREEKKPIYLPFADADRKTTEIISKIVLLSDDDCITDSSINSQIDMAVNKIDISS